MSVESDIRNGLVTLIKQNSASGNAAFSAEVTAVDVPNRSCTVVGISDLTGTEYTNVWLMPETTDGILYVPKVGSTVIVQNNANLQPYVAMWTEITGLLYVVEDTVISMTDGLTQFNKGENFGLVNVKPLTEKIKALEEDLNDLKQAIAAWTPVPNDGGAAFKTQLTALYPSTPFTLIQQSDIEDDSVTH